MDKSTAQQGRRVLLKGAYSLAGVFALSRLPGLELAASAASGVGMPREHKGFTSLFDGKSLCGWTRQARELAHPSLGKWVVQDGIIIGGQEKPGLGSYLVTDETFADFELLIDAWPDWPADTGIYVRTTPQGNVGFQVLVDYRPHGNVGGYYGNGIGRFHAWTYGLEAKEDKAGHLLRLTTETPTEPKGNHAVPLDFAAPADVFLRTWKVNTWNTFRIRSVGALPRLTTWINGVKISELDTSKLQFPGWDPQAVLEKVERAGHIALEVHSNGPHDWLGKNRWTPGAVCRWRNISIKKLST